MSGRDRILHLVVIVLGDIGRSPRMQYHALSLLEAGHIVSLVGYDGEAIVPALSKFQDGKKLHVLRFRVPFPKFIRRLRPVYFVWRIFSLSLCLLWVLLTRVPTQPAVDCLLVQNPPALPLLVVAYVFRFLQSSLKRVRRPAVVIDWHNLGYSMLNPGAFRRLAQAYEKVMAPYADYHFTVTEAMKEFVARELALPHCKIRVLPDCPPSIFRPLSEEEQHAILTKLHPQLSVGVPGSWGAAAPPVGSGSVPTAATTTTFTKTTLLTEYQPSATPPLQYRPRRGRPALVTSSTSWTPDEDFGVLLGALLQLDDRIAKEESHLRIMVVVTGKGPQKAEYEERISKLKLRSVAIQTLWLEPGDYPRLLACADVGVSLHTSTSGLDLPMKVLDLFGCGVPVCALDFACLSELVQERVNGRVFGSETELSEVLWELLSPLADEPAAAGAHDFGALKQYSSNILRDLRRWDENWRDNALPVLLDVVDS